MRQPDFVVEWYRPRLFGRLFLAWLAAASALSVGAVGLGLALDGTERLPDDLRLLAGVVGAAGTLVGAVGGIFGIMRLVTRDDSYLLVRRSGLEVSSGRPGGAVRIPWQELVDATVVGGRVQIEREGGPPVRLGPRYQGIDAQGLAARLIELRRQALLGALRPARAGRS